MAELAPQAEVYAPRSVQVLKTLLNWLAFFFQIFVQIVRGTPSVTQVLSYVGLSFLSSTSPSFKPLPLAPDSTELQDPPSAALQILGDTKRLTVVLDLDETLVCAYETSSLPAIVRDQATEAGLKWFELECISSEKECEGKPKINYVTVFERPGLSEFLKQLSEFADLVLFTAGLEGYARPLVDRIDVENRFCNRLYRPSTISTEYREHVKDLSCLSKDLCRTVIVDNNPFSFLLQPVNGIPCIPFSAGQPHDDQLLEVLLPLGAIGHLLGAAGAVEAIFAVLAMYHGIAPLTLNLTEPEPVFENHFMPLTASKEIPIRAAMSNSFGFGGTNTSLLFSAIS